MKHIILCVDGTWQSGSGVTTNVSWIAQHVDVSSHRVNPTHTRQVVGYVPGVGTEGPLLSKIVGGATGWGITPQLRDCYEALVKHYEPGDRISIFAFSRGAYAARRLVEWLSVSGLVDLGIYPTDMFLKDAIRRAFRNFTVRHGIRDRPPSPSFDCQFNFVGLFDTVGSLGIPVIRVLTRTLLGWWYQLFGTGLNRVLHVCQAMALDEQRRDFRVVPLSRRQRLYNAEQVWFVGSHGDVGGTYSDRRLANIPLKWMVDRAISHGIRFDCSVPRDPKDYLAPVQESSKGLWLLRGRGPRLVERSGQLDESVLRRLNEDHTYKPYALSSTKEHLSRWL